MCGKRIEYFFDPGTFSELGLFGHSAARGMAEKTPTDGKIIGYGEVNGRPVAIAANDITILGASSSATNTRKLEYIKTYAVQNGLPLVFFGESSGQRMPDAMGAGRMSQGGRALPSTGGCEPHPGFPFSWALLRKFVLVCGHVRYVWLCRKER